MSEILTRWIQFRVEMVDHRHIRVLSTNYKIADKETYILPSFFIVNGLSKIPVTPTYILQTNFLVELRVPYPNLFKSLFSP